MSEEMGDEALNKIGNLLKSIKASTVKGGKIALLAPVKISAAIAKAAAEEAKKKLKVDE